MGKQLALTKDGRMTPCSVPAEMRGIGKCPHVAHAYGWETAAQTTRRFEDLQKPKNTNFNNSALNREYNRKAWLETDDKLKEFGRCCIVQGTSTGKSSIFCRIAEDYANKEILVITPTNEQVNQLHKDYKIKGDVETYASFCRAGMNDLGKYDLVILDECHHIGDPDNVCAKKINEMIEYKEDLMILGATATPLRTDNKNPIDSIFKGVSSSNISTEEVFEQGYLRKPKVVQIENTDFYADEFMKMYADKKSNLNNQYKPGTEKKAGELVREIEKARKENDSIVENALSEKIKENIKNGEASKLIVFCNDAKDQMQATKDKMDAIIQKACDANNIKMVSNKFTNSEASKMSVSNRKDIMNEFKNDKKVEVLYVYNMLGEGVHIEGVNMEINTRKTGSVITAPQQLGRVLNGPDKQKSDPLYIDYTGDFDEKIPYSKCIDNRVTSSNYGKIDKLYREIKYYGADTYSFRGKERNVPEVCEIICRENNLDMQKNKKIIKDILKGGLVKGYRIPNNIKPDDIMDYSMLFE